MKINKRQLWGRCKSIRVIWIPEHTMSWVRIPLQAKIHARVSLCVTSICTKLTQKGYIVTMTIRVSSPVDRSNKQMSHFRFKMWLLILKYKCLSEWLSSLGSVRMQNITWLAQCEKYHLAWSVWKTPLVSVSMKNITWLGQYEKHHLARSVLKNISWLGQYEIHHLFRSVWKTPLVSVSMKNTTWLGQYEIHHLFRSVRKTPPGSVSMKNNTWLRQYEKPPVSVSMKNIICLRKYEKHHLTRSVWKLHLARSVWKISLDSFSMTITNCTVCVNERWFCHLKKSSGSVNIKKSHVLVSMKKVTWLCQ